MCPRHPELPAIGACTRCGGFICAQDVVQLDKKPYCQACAALPGVDYLEQFRLKYWGKRDGWAWLFLFNAVLLPIVAVGALVPSLGPMSRGEVVGTVTSLALAVASGAYFAGYRPMRFLVLVLPLLTMLGAVLANDSIRLAEAGIVSLLPMLIGLAIFFDTRNRLFFKVQVSRDRLQRLWDIYENNPIARAAFVGGMISMVMFPLAPLTLALAIIGLTRVNPTSHPPVGRKGQAVAGIVFSVIGLVVFAAMVLSAVLP